VYAAVWLATALGLAISVSAAIWLRQEARRTDEARFAILVEQTRQNFDNLTENYQHALERLADAIGARKEFTKAHWDLQLHRLAPEVDFRGLVEIQLIRVVFATNLPPDLEGLTGDDLHWNDKEKILQLKKAINILTRSRVRLEPMWNYIPQNATVPDGQGTPGDGLDDHLKLVRVVMESQSLRMTGRRVVLRYRDGREVAGTTFILPVPDEALARAWSTNLLHFRNTAQGSRHNAVKVFTGLRNTSAILCGSIDWRSIISPRARELQPELHLDLYADAKPGTKSWLAGSATLPLAPAAAARASFSTNYPVKMYSSKWTLAIHTTPLFNKQSTHYRAYVALFGGTVVTLLVAGLLGAQVRARVRQQNIAGELRRSLAALEAARAEREGLGRDLHDGAIQSLYALQLGLSRTSEQARAAAPEMAERLADYRRGVSGIIGELRGFILRQEAETSSGANLCRVLTASLNRLRPTTVAELCAELDANAAARLDSEQAVHLASIAREALSNSLRHATAAHIKVVLGSENGTVRLEICDDGCGFAPGGLPPGGMGLANMSGRAREAGGELKVDTSPGCGTRVVVRVAVAETILPSAAKEKATA